LGVATAKQIAQTAGIDRGEIYRQLEILQEKSLVEKILNVPNEYKPMPINEAIGVLIQRRDEENAEIRQKVKALLNKRADADILKEWESKISIIPWHDYLKKYISEANERVQKEWLWFTQIERIPIVITTHYKSFKKALDRGVRWHAIAELNEPTDQIVEFIQKFRKENPNFAIRFAIPTLLVTFAILDSKELDFFTKVAKGAADSPALYTNNPQIVKVIKEFFELRWKTAITEYPKKGEGKTCGTNEHH